MECNFFIYLLNFFVKGKRKREQGDPGRKPLKAGGSRSVSSTVRICALECSLSDQLRNPVFSSL